MVEKLKFERRSEHEEFETFGIVLQRKLNSMGLMINLLQLKFRSLEIYFVDRKIVVYSMKYE